MQADLGGENSSRKPKIKRDANRHYNTESSVREPQFAIRRSSFELSWTESSSNPFARYFVIVRPCSIGWEASAQAKLLP